MYLDRIDSFLCIDSTQETGSNIFFKIEIEINENYQVIHFKGFIQFFPSTHKISNEIQ